MKRLLLLLWALVALFCWPSAQHPLFEDENQPKLLEISIGEGTFFEEGLSVVRHDHGWVPGTRIAPFWKDQGYDGVRLIGAGQDKTFLDGRGGENALLLSKHSGYVELVDLTIIGGARQAIFAGFDARGDVPRTPLTISLKRVLVKDSGVRWDEESTEWLVFTYGADIRIEDSIFDGENTNEHGVYAHGFFRFGAAIRGLEVLGIGAEALKFTNRPLFSAYLDPGGWIGSHAHEDGVRGVDPGIAFIYVAHSKIRNWHQPQSWRGGAGMTVQGGGLNVVVTDCLFEAREGDWKPCIAIDDSGGEAYAQDGYAVQRRLGRAPNGHIMVRRCLMKSAGTFGEWPQPRPILRLGSNGTQLGEEHPLALSLTVEDCAILGDGSMIEVQRMPEHLVSFDNINTELMLEQAAEYGLEAPLADLNWNGYFEDFVKD